ncbi:HD domain-containing protein [Parasedimentitalea marina]|uniref:5'-deoxynucleotidase n=1 Tax=Parasedimentitalea marina TaxID=2483033 RepID=A0A3T0N2I0_9RHOB|nr:HD domain-containing protein [Parasedimentitalea marina]AZV78238.1 HD domain-containing protein [Parasedimentitalea marina]
MTSRLDGQFEFLLEADKLRQVERANLILDCSRRENSAEHSWHLALYALVLAPLAAPDVKIARVIKMLLLHDLVEIDVGDHPIHEATNWHAVAQAEQVAAKRLFGLLPDDQGADMLALWQEFETNQSSDARFAKQLDRCQPIFQTLYGACPVPEHLEIVKNTLDGGRAASLEHEFPEAYLHAQELLGRPAAKTLDSLTCRLPFLNEADGLKQVLRATLLGNGSRRENSAEHSWHIMLYAWVLAEHSADNIDIDRVMIMLLLHDIVEIDAGDAPIHGHIDQVALAAKEEAAATRLFGLLPKDQDTEFNTLWHEFEAAESHDAIFAKSIDRVQPVLLNLLNGGGSWVEYQVSLDQIDTRVGQKVLRGAPEVWHHVRARIKPWFDAV